MANLKIIVFLACQFLVSSCVSDDTAGNVDGKVVEVRVTAEREFRSSGDPLGGAILGGFIAGTTGAIVGTAMESNGELNLQSRLRGCRVTIQTNDGNIVAFNYVYEEFKVTRCSLMRPGDYANLHTEQFRNGQRGYWFLSEFGEVIPL